jgi:hypothetical protein
MDKPMKTTPLLTTATDADFYRTAIHEAGHVVIALKLGARVKYVEIGDGAADADPSDYVKALGAVRVGVTKLAPAPNDPLFGMTKLGYLVHCLAGEAAEKCAGVWEEPPSFRAYSGDRDDFNRALALVPSRPYWLPYSVRKKAEECVKRLVEESRSAILHMAQQLLDWKYFGEGEIGEVMKGHRDK